MKVLVLSFLCLSSLALAAASRYGESILNMPENTAITLKEDVLLPVHSTIRQLKTNDVGYGCLLSYEKSLHNRMLRSGRTVFHVKSARAELHFVKQIQSSFVYYLMTSIELRTASDARFTLVCRDYKSVIRSPRFFTLSAIGQRDLDRMTLTVSSLKSTVDIDLPDTEEVN